VRQRLTHWPLLCYPAVFATKTSLHFSPAPVEQHKKLRLYGLLIPVDEKTRKSKKAPSVEFITWKAHLPSDPDDLAPDQKITIGPNDRVEGDKVEPKKP
jgi:hypothetical protein